MPKLLVLSIATTLALFSSVSRAGLIYDFSSSSDPTTFGFIELDTTIGGTWGAFSDVLSFDVTVDGVNFASASGAGVGGCFGCFDYGPVTPSDPFVDPANGAITLSQDPGNLLVPELILGTQEVARIDGQCAGSVIGCWNVIGGSIVRDITWSARQQIPAPPTVALVAIGLIGARWRRIPKLPRQPRR